MTKEDDEAMRRREAEIFEAGAKATSPDPVVNGDKLGSLASCIFYDGYASTHPGFVNPYRRS